MINAGDNPRAKRVLVFSSYFALLVFGCALLVTATFYGLVSAFGFFFCVAAAGLLILVMRRKWFKFYLLALFLVLIAFSHIHMRAMRRARIWNDRVILSMSYRNFAQNGVVTNYGGSTQPYIYTNVVAVGGSNYPCILAIGHPFYGGQGILAMTTNQVFIWLDRKRGAKIIDDAYEPPLFSPRF